MPDIVLYRLFERKEGMKGGREGGRKGGRKTLCFSKSGPSQETGARLDIQTEEI